MFDYSNVPAYLAGVAIRTVSGSAANGDRNAIPNLMVKKTGRIFMNCWTNFCVRGR